MENILEYLPLLIPIVLLEWTLAIVALVHILRHKHYKLGNRVVWILVVLLVQIIGPILYFILGRDDEES